MEWRVIERPTGGARQTGTEGLELTMRQPERVEVTGCLLLQRARPESWRSECEREWAEWKCFAKSFDTKIAREMGWPWMRIEMIFFFKLKGTTHSGPIGWWERSGREVDIDWVGARGQSDSVTDVHVTYSVTPLCILWPCDREWQCSVQLYLNDRHGYFVVYFHYQ